jgi:hypothetical protein
LRLRNRFCHIEFHYLISFPQMVLIWLNPDPPAAF